MRTLWWALTAAAAAIACAATPAQAASPRLDPQAAYDVAVRHWAQAPCRSVVRLSWGRMDVRDNAISSWLALPGAPAADNTDCSITLNRQVIADWPKLCTVMVHEVGHLLGHDHAPAGAATVMAENYDRPIPVCRDHRSRQTRARAARRGR